MTALELNAELYRAMAEIADDETLLNKVLTYVKKLAVKKEEGVTASPELQADIEKARQELEEGKTLGFNSANEAQKWMEAELSHRVFSESPESDKEMEKVKSCFFQEALCPFARIGGTSSYRFCSS